MKKLLIILSLATLAACGTTRTSHHSNMVLYWSQWLTNIKYLPGDRQMITYTKLTEWTPAPKGFVLNNGLPKDGKVVYQIMYK